MAYLQITDHGFLQLQDTLEIYELKELIREFELASARTKLINCPCGNVLIFEIFAHLSPLSVYHFDFFLIF